MSLSEDHGEDRGIGEADTLDRRAAALVNPASGLANDFLNVYNEILMLIEMLPGMPDLIDDVVAWRPTSYRAYFMQSTLPGARIALDAYNRLDPSFRAVFEATIEQLAGDCLTSVARIERAAAGGTLAMADECERATHRMRQVLDAATQLVAFGHSHPGANMQERATAIFAAA